jgi:hypothetical protein
MEEEQAVKRKLLKDQLEVVDHAERTQYQQDPQIERVGH